MAQKKAKIKKRKKIVRKISSGEIYVYSTFNNTIITATDTVGKVLCWSSPGIVGFKGSKKSTPFAASIAAKDLTKKVKLFGVTQVDVFLTGPGSAKESVIRSLKSEKLEVKKIIDTTPTPHNGCRPKKKRRV